MEKKLNIGGRLVGQDEKPYIVAEIGNNHNGDINLCKKMVDAAKSCRADAVKFQSWLGTSLFSKFEYERKKGDRYVLDLKEAERYQLTVEMHYEIRDYCREKGITFFSSVLSLEEVDLLDSLDVPAFKIPSGELINIRLLEHVAAKKRPVILSTGMATLGEIEKAVDILHVGGVEQLALMHCVSFYPPEYEMINLRNIAMLQQTFELPVGFSDHTLGIVVPLAAIACGACMIEKHFTLDKKMEGWDHAISADPTEMELIVKEGLNVFKSLGYTSRKITPRERDMRKLLSRSVILKKDKKKGEVLTGDDIDFKRPGTGIRPDEFQFVLGRRLVRDMEAEELLGWDDLS